MICNAVRFGPIRFQDSFLLFLLGNVWDTCIYFYDAALLPSIFSSVSISGITLVSTTTCESFVVYFTALDRWERLRNINKIVFLELSIILYIVLIIRFESFHPGGRGV